MEPEVTFTTAALALQEWSWTVHWSCHFVRNFYVVDQERETVPSSSDCGAGRGVTSGLSVLGDDILADNASPNRNEKKRLPLSRCSG